MKCPTCDQPDSRVVESRVVPGGVNKGMRRRRRVCGCCGLTYPTYQKQGGDERAIEIGYSTSQTHVAVVMAAAQRRN